MLEVHAILKVSICCRYIAESTTLTFWIVNLDITGSDEGFILQLCWEIVEKAPFDYSVFEQILIFFNIRLFG